MPNFRSAVFLAALSPLFLISPVFADRLAEGQALAKSKGCFECHGKSGNNAYDTPPPMPKIAGMPKNYLVSAMQDYRTGIRQNAVMTTMMTKRTDEEIELLAEYYSAQERY